MNTPLLEVQQLSKYYFVQKQNRIALCNVSLHLTKGQTYGIVGESGSGKSTLGKTMLRLTEPTSGKIFYRNQELTHLANSLMKPYRKSMQMIFQDPYSSLNPRMTVADIIAEPLDIHESPNSFERWQHIYHLLDIVRLPRSSAGRFPHEFSGGQRQRIGIARALSLRPELIVCDEPTSALDVSIQAQIINLLLELQEEFGLTYLFISHNLSLVKIVSDTIAVMFAGEIVEKGNSEELYHHPLHPYTQMLISTIQPLFSDYPQTSPILKDPGLPIACRYCTRCSRAKAICFVQKPPLIEVLPNHYVACFFSEPISSTLVTPNSCK